MIIALCRLVRSRLGGHGQLVPCCDGGLPLEYTPLSLDCRRSFRHTGVVAAAIAHVSLRLRHSPILWTSEPVLNGLEGGFDSTWRLSRPSCGVATRGYRLPRRGQKVEPDPDSL